MIMRTKKNGKPKTRLLVAVQLLVCCARPVAAVPDADAVRKAVEGVEGKITLSPEGAARSAARREVRRRNRGVIHRPSAEEMVAPFVGLRPPAAAR